MREEASQLFLVLWVQAKGSWECRTDNSKHHAGKIHIHIRKKRGLKGEYSWNMDGSRHDKHRYQANKKMIDRAKEIASEKLNVPIDTLQFISELPMDQPEIVLFDEHNVVIFVDTVILTGLTVLLAGNEWIVAVGIWDDNAIA